MSDPNQCVSCSWATASFWCSHVRVGRCPCAVPAALFQSVHGTRDRVVPWSHGRELHALLVQPVAPVWAEGAGHNNIEYMQEHAYYDGLKAFVGALAGGAGGGASGGTSAAAVPDDFRTDNSLALLERP